MLEVAEIFRLHGATYRARFGERLLPGQARAMHRISRRAARPTLGAT